MKIIKIIIYSVLIINTLYASQLEEEYVKKYNFDKSKYENLDKVDTKKINENLIKYQTDVDVFKQMDLSKNMVQNNDFISKEEYSLLNKEILDIKNSMGTGPFSFILYFTSSSVPSNTMMNILYSLSILQDNGIKMFSKQYLIGPPTDFQEYMFSLNNTLEEKYPSIIAQEKIKRNYGLKIDPRYFDYFKLKEVPAIALATCPSLTPDIEKCEFHYLMKGDISLLKFFDKISKEDDRYERLTKILIANKIVDKEGN